MNVTTVEQEFQFVAAQLTTEELIELDRRVVEGYIDGRNFFKEGCGCFYGSIAAIRGIVMSEDQWRDAATMMKTILGKKMKPLMGMGAFTPIERLVMGIRPFDTPENDRESEELHNLLTAEITRRQS